MREQQLGRGLMPLPVPEAEDILEEEEEELGHAETYNDYMPTKCKYTP